MEFISAEEFLNQPIDIQRVFIDWWEPEIGDLFIWIKNDDEYEHDLRKFECCNSFNIAKMTKDFKEINEGDRIPLLTEGQLRQFIEDKGYLIEISQYGKEWYYLGIRHKEDPTTGNIISYDGKMLELYWKAACDIVKGE